MVWVQAEEQGLLQREAMKPGEPGDIQTLGETEMRQLENRQSTIVICPEAKRRLSLLEKNDSASKKRLYQIKEVDGQ
jgi:hypothetical protein